MSTRIDHDGLVGRRGFPTLGAKGLDFLSAFFLHAFLQERDITHFEAQPLSKLTSARQLSIFCLAKYLSVQFVNVIGKYFVLGNWLDVSCHDPI